MTAGAARRAEPFLADTSVWTRRRHPSIAPWFDVSVAEGDVAMCEMVALEILHAARTAAEYTQLERALRALPWMAIDARVTARALEISGLLAERGNAHHRSVKHADLFIAATAEVHGVELVHYDRDYDAIRQVTGQPARWVAPRDSL
jgi:predicted nucleic acid-binding protein